ncbi:MAG: GTPase [Candidatus Fermentibacteraceae bacterium]
MNPSTDIIAAVATPPGLSALAVVRLSGPGSAALVEGLCGVSAGRLSGLRRLLVEIPGVGDAVALGWPEGKSYTGEEMVELMCHGIPERVSRLYGAVLGAGARSALPGEFTARAWRNGRISGQQIIELAAATETGSTSARLPEAVIELQERVSQALETLEGSIEFQDDSCPAAANPVAALQRAEEAAEALLTSTHSLQRVMKVYLMGRVNAGKSTLMNCLCGGEVALVDPSPGTTRDGARREIVLMGRRFLLVDTPGFGGEGIDSIALDNVIREITSDDTVLWLSPEGESPPEPIERSAGRVVLAVSKSDTHRLEGFRVSSVSGEGREPLCEKLLSTGSSPVEQSASEILTLLEHAADFVETEPGIAAALLREAEEKAVEMTGFRHDIDAVERALSVLCVGK